MSGPICPDTAAAEFRTQRPVARPCDYCQQKGEIGQPSSFIPRALGVIIVLSLVFLGQGYWNATRAPVVQTAQLGMADWPADAPPLRLVLISDVHVAGPDMVRHPIFG